MIEEATFAGGCFWCLEEAFSKLHGIVEVIPGYAGGEKEDPSYEDVISGNTGHVEAVKVKYDSQKISYKDLLITFWSSIDPTDRNGQFADRGSHYQTVIFYHTKEQKILAEKSKKILEESGLFEEPIATQIKPFKNFYAAEEYHRRYFEKEPFRYEKYKELSGRKGYCEIVWKRKGGIDILKTNL